MAAPRGHRPRRRPGTVPAYLRRCAPGSPRRGTGAATRRPRGAWTYADLPLLDAARLRLGDPEAPRRRRLRNPPGLASARGCARWSTTCVRPRASQVPKSSATGRVDARARRPAYGPGRRGALATTDPTSWPVRSHTSWWTRRRSSPTRSGTCCCVAARRAVSRSSATARRPAMASPSPGAAARGDRAAPVDRRAPDGQLPHAGGGDGRGRTGHPGRAPEANVTTSVRESGIPVLHSPAAERDAIIEEWLAGARRGHRGRHRRPDVRRSAARPLAHARARQGPRVRPGRPRRPRPASAAASPAPWTATSR